MKRYLTLFIPFLVSIAGFSQTDSTPKIDSSKFVRFFKVENLDEVEELDFEKEQEIPKEFKKKKLKRKVYYGYKTKKSFTKTGYGASEVTEIFHYVKVWQDPSPYVKEIYWFDVKHLKITESKRYDPLTSKLLHGPYKKMLGGEVIEEGIFYLGTKHGRWVSYDRPKDYEFRSGDKDHNETIDGEKTLVEGTDTLINYQLVLTKENYNRGWPKHAQSFYYDAAKTLLKEVIPYNEKGKMTGEYYSFFKDGNIHLHGHYINGSKVGVWIEYHVIGGKNRHFKEIKYPDFPEEKEPKGEVIRLWNEKGELILDIEAKVDKRTKEEKEAQK
jgi:hypothetical protein